jgi:signal transduction histidine kinase
MTSLGLNQDQLDEIRKNLSQQVYHRADLLGLNDRIGAASWCDMISKTAADLARDNTRLSQDNRIYAVSSGHVDFVEQFFASVDPSDAPIDIAAVFGRLWQKHYQTGPVAVYLCDDPSEPILDVAMVDNSSQVDTAVVTIPTGRPAVPESLQGKFAIIPAADSASWIFEQIALVIDSSKAFIAPLRAGTKTVGAIIFEKRLPGDLDMQLPVFSLTSAVAANVIALSLASQRQGRLAERFAELLGRLRDTRDKLAASTILTGIAEMAAGAGHEMNNPLSVISGRVQLLMESEDDDNKKQILKQIMDRSDEMSQIITDMMSFARPKDPAAAGHSLQKLLDGAVSKTSEAHELTAMEITYNAIDQLGEVFVDAGQIITAIAAVLSNALDSYKGGSGPITIDGDQQQGGITIRITDTGCGMTADTLEKAFQPFFSDKLAGRKRGMGLARAMRLIELNNGSINIQSQLEEGTTVTITLPTG